MSFALLGLEPHILLTILVSLIVFLWRKHLGLPSDSVSPQGCPEPCRGTDGTILNLPCSSAVKNLISKNHSIFLSYQQGQKAVRPPAALVLGSQGGQLHRSTPWWFLLWEYDFYWYRMDTWVSCFHLSCVTLNCENSLSPLFLVWYSLPVLGGCCGNRLFRVFSGFAFLCY